MVKQAGVFAWLIGIAALVGLAVWSGLDAVGHAFSSVGWGILLVVLGLAAMILPPASAIGVVEMSSSRAARPVPVTDW